MVGLAALTMLAAMAIVGASSAMATGNTALCADESNPCENPVTSLHMELTNIGILHGLSPLFNVLCLHGLALGEVLSLGNPQAVHLSKLDFTNCGTNSTHTNCTISSLELPVLVNVLNEGGGLGKATGENGETLVNCTIPLIGTIDCIYEGKGLSFDVKSAEAGNHGMLNAEAVSVKKTAGSGFCSAESTITQGLLEPLTDVYLSS